MPRRIVRQLLVASLITLHAAVALCGPCLHELPGLGHDSGLGSTATQGKAPLKGSHDSADSCPVCHFLAQGQIPISISWTLAQPHAEGWVSSLSPPVKVVRGGPQSRPRAPPIVQL